jgi:hypothetical protein
MAPRALTRLLSSCYYGIKLFPFRTERRERLAGGRQKGLVGVQIDGLAFPFMQQALDRGYLPHLERYLRRGHKLVEYHAGLPSTTPAAQAVYFYGNDHSIPAFRWFEKQSGQIISCNDGSNSLPGKPVCWPAGPLIQTSSTEMPSAASSQSPHPIRRPCSAVSAGGASSCCCWSTLYAPAACFLPPASNSGPTAKTNGITGARTSGEPRKGCSLSSASSAT